MNQIKNGGYHSEKRGQVSASKLGMHVGEVIRIHGSIYKIRRMSGFSFVLLRTAREIVQCIYNGESSGFKLEGLKEESCVILEGRVVAEERARCGYELHLSGIEILSEPYESAPIVINNKRVDTSIENLLHYRPITLRNERERAIFKIQEGICMGIRQFLQGEHFTEIHTPKLVSEGAEGGANIFRLNYFGREAFLAQSPQFYKQMMVGVFERVYEIAPVFRAEKHDTSRHLNEYTSVDLEMGFIEGFEEIMELEANMLRATLGFLEQNYQPELALLQAVLPVIEDIPVVRFSEAKALISKKYNRCIKDYRDFEPEEEKLLCELILEQTGSEFVFVTHYPEEKRPFYAMDSSEGIGGQASSGAEVPEAETLSFDLLFRGLEITTGGQRIHDYREQVRKMERRGMKTEQFESYLMMHKYGMMPHGGLGLGLERFTGRLLNLENVRYASAFPRDIGRLTP